MLPLPPRAAIGEEPKRRKRQAFLHHGTPSASQLELAEWVEFPEKDSHFGPMAHAFGGWGLVALTADF
jgi:hypothetical protein